MSSTVDEATGGFEDPDTHPGSVLLIGPDGADAALLPAAIEAGELPHLAGLGERGAPEGIRRA